MERPRRRNADSPNSALILIPVSDNPTSRRHQSTAAAKALHSPFVTDKENPLKDILIHSQNKLQESRSDDNDEHDEDLEHIEAALRLLTLKSHNDERRSKTVRFTSTVEIREYVRWIGDVPLEASRPTGAKLEYALSLAWKIHKVYSVSLSSSDMHATTAGLVPRVPVEERCRLLAGSMGEYTLAEEVAKQRGRSTTRATQVLQQQLVAFVAGATLDPP
jgi:hypothetical protein